MKLFRKINISILVLFSLYAVYTPAIVYSDIDIFNPDKSDDQVSSIEKPRERHIVHTDGVLIHDTSLRYIPTNLIIYSAYVDTLHVTYFYVPNYPVNNRSPPFYS